MFKSALFCSVSKGYPETLVDMDYVVEYWENAKVLELTHDVKEDELDDIRTFFLMTSSLEEIRYGSNVSLDTVIAVNQELKNINMQRVKGNDLSPTQVIQDVDLTDSRLKDLEMLDNDSVVIEDTKTEAKMTLHEYQEYLKQNNELQSEVRDVNTSSYEEVAKMHTNIEDMNKYGDLKTNPLAGIDSKEAIYKEAATTLGAGIAASEFEKGGEYHTEVLNLYDELSKREQELVTDNGRDYSDLRNNINMILDTPKEYEYTNIKVDIVTFEGSTNTVTAVEKITPKGSHTVLESTLPYDKTTNGIFLEPLTADFAMRSPVFYTESSESALNVRNKDVVIMASNNNVLNIGNIDFAEADKLIGIANSTEASLYDTKRIKMPVLEDSVTKEMEHSVLTKKLEPPKGHTNALIILGLVSIIAAILLVLLNTGK